MLLTTTLCFALITMGFAGPMRSNHVRDQWDGDDEPLHVPVAEDVAEMMPDIIARNKYYDYDGYYVSPETVRHIIEMYKEKYAKGYVGPKTVDESEENHTYKNVGRGNQRYF